MKQSLVKELKSKGGILIKPNPLTDNLLKLKIIKAWNRYHQKVYLIDNDLFIGSINSSDEYTGYKYGAFKYVDLNVYVKNSPCIDKVLLFFREILEENIRQIKNGEKRIVEIFSRVNSIINNTNITNKNHIPPIEMFLEERPPTKSEIQDALYEILDSAKESITIIQAYYLNLKRIEDCLKRAQDRGVKITIITAEKRDQIVYKYIYNQQLFSMLMKNGAEVYEFLDKSFHMKAYYVDRRLITLGSFNNDITSFVMNNEANYLIKRTNHNEVFFDDFDRMILDIKNNCRKLNYLDVGYLPKTRLYMSYFFYFWLWLMERSIANRKLKYDN
jgi:phosphatidylserine/phosphatidylglycerophosphate/cardiolipin synthase-like enzyme